MSLGLTSVSCALITLEAASPAINNSNTIMEACELGRLINMPSLRQRESENIRAGSYRHILLAIE